MRKQLSRIFAGLLLALAFAGLYHRFHLNFSDPDRYYHFALSREMVQSGKLFLRSLPQVEDLGWGEFFVDKEFLFHQFTRLGYLIHGELGAEWAIVLLTISGILVFFGFASRSLPVSSAAAVTFFAYSCPFFLTRLLLLRPHVIGILGFVLMNIAVLSRMPLATGFAVFFFTLSYHAFYIPLACLGFLGALTFIDRESSAKEWRRTVVYGALGCLAGILANPYFPENIEIALVHARIPGLIAGELRDLNFGSEHTPLRSDSFLEVFHMPLLVLLMAFFVLGNEWRERGGEALQRRLKTLYISGVSVLFLILAFKTMRAGEYLAIATGLLAVYLLSSLKKRPALMVAIPLIFGLGDFSIFYRALMLENPGQIDHRLRETIPAIEAIPKEPRGAKVYNCEWDFSPYIFYFRPDLRFIDIMDPSLLYFRPNRGPFKARDDLRRGALGDPLGMIRDAAKADYVMCNDPSVNAQLREDPGFQQIYPKRVLASNDGRVPSLFLVKKDSVNEYARTFSVSKLDSYPAGALPKLGAVSIAEEKHEVELKVSSYLDLRPLLAEKLRAENSYEKGDFRCAVLSPSKAEMESRAGASVLMVGGGQGLEVWRNGRPLFRSSPAFSTNRSTQVAIPLSPALRKGDSLEILVCSGASSPFWGLALSLWTEQQLKEVCAWKEAVVKKVTPLHRWEHEGLQSFTCLAPWAAKPKQ